MTTSQIYDMTTLVSPLLTALGGWWIGRRKRKNDFLSDLQGSIDLLSRKNKELMDQLIEARQELIALRESNLILKRSQQQLQSNLLQLGRENDRLLRKIEEWGERLESTHETGKYPRRLPATPMPHIH